MTVTDRRLAMSGARRRRLAAIGLAVALTPPEVMAQPPPVEPPPRLDQLAPTIPAVRGWLERQASRADTQCVALLADGSRLSGKLTSWSAPANFGIDSQALGATLSLSPEATSQLQFHPQVALPILLPARVELRDGSWVQGATVRQLDSRSLHIGLPFADRVTLARNAVTRIDFRDMVQRVQAEVQVGPLQRLQTRVTPMPPMPRLDAGRIWLTNGDVISGTPRSIDNGLITFALEWDEAVIRPPVEQVSRIAFPPADWHAATVDADQVWAQIMLVTGERLYGVLQRLTPRTASLQWHGSNLVEIPRGLIHTIGEFSLGAAGVRQWATSATASSEYRRPMWGAVQATGAPNTLTAGDHNTAWAPREQDGGEEWIELRYATAVTPVRIRVRETFNPGAVVRVTAFNPQGEEVTLWQGLDTTHGAPAWLVIPVKEAPFKTRRLRVYLDTGLVRGWNEIDAVELTGKP